MAEYQLTSEADGDILEIARYTVRIWGEEQAELYEGKLQNCFKAIAKGTARSKTLLKTRPELLVVRCEHHYVFYRKQKGKTPLIIAVFHENMNLIKRVSDRLKSKD